MFLQFGYGAYDYSEYRTSPVELENWFVEQAPERPDLSARLVPVPGLSEFASGFSGDPRGVFQSDGVIEGDVVACTDTSVYRVTSDSVVSVLGTVVASDDEAVFAASQTPQLILAKGGRAYEVEGAGVTDFTSSLPFSGEVVSIAVIAQRHLYAESGSGRLWFSEVADARNVGANSFITAEQNPDEIRAVFVNGEEIWLFGTKTTELWYYTGSSTAPFSYRGVSIPKGLINNRAVAVSDSAMHFIGEDRMIYRVSGAQAMRISTHPIEKKLQNESEIAKLRLSSHVYFGHTFLAVHIPSYGDLFYDAATKFWHRRRGRLASDSNFTYPAAAFSSVLFLSNCANGTKLLKATNDTYLEDEDYVSRTATALLPVKDGRVRLNRLTIDGQAGVGLDGNTQGSEPRLRLFVARDGQRYNRPPMERSLGRIGQYDYRPNFGPIGVLDGPLVAFKIVLSDPVGFSVNGVQLNLARP